MKVEEAWKEYLNKKKDYYVLKIKKRKSRDPYVTGYALVHNEKYFKRYKLYHVMPFEELVKQGMAAKQKKF